MESQRIFKIVEDLENLRLALSRSTMFAVRLGTRWCRKFCLKSITNRKMRVHHPTSGAVRYFPDPVILKKKGTTIKR